MKDDRSEGVLRSLARLLSLGPGVEDTWDSQDYHSMLDHQLAAPLVDLLVGLPTQEIAQAREALRQSGLTTYGQLLAGAQPPVLLLDLARRDFKSQARQNDGLLPAEVARALYYAVVVVGVTRIGRWFSLLSDKDLCAAVTWGLQRPWLNGPLRDILQQGQAYLERLPDTAGRVGPGGGTQAHPGHA